LRTSSSSIVSSRKRACQSPVEHVDEALLALEAHASGREEPSLLPDSLPQNTLTMTCLYTSLLRRSRSHLLLHLLMQLALDLCASAAVDSYELSPALSSRLLALYQLAGGIRLRAYKFRLCRGAVRPCSCYPSSRSPLHETLSILSPRLYHFMYILHYTTPMSVYPHPWMR